MLRNTQLVVRKSNKPIKSETVSTKDLDPKDELFFPWNEPYKKWHDQMWGTSKTPRRIEFILPGLIEPFLQTVGSWIIAPKSVTIQYRNRGKCFVQRIDPPPPERISYLVTHQHMRDDALLPIEILKSIMKKLGYFID